MSRVIDIKTRRDVTPPPTLGQRITSAALKARSVQYARDELAVCLVRIATGCEAVVSTIVQLPPGDHAPALAQNILREIGTLLQKLGAK